MEERRVVVLCGTSLFLAGVEASLRDRPELEVVRVDTTLPDIGRCLKLLHPHAIIFDSGETGLDVLPDATQLLRENPGILVIGLDLTSNEVTVWSGRQCSVTKAEDLVKAIRAGTERG